MRVAWVLSADGFSLQASAGITVMSHGTESPGFRGTIESRNSVSKRIDFSVKKLMEMHEKCIV